MIDSCLLRPDLPLLPLVLWQTPPALEQALAQEGVPHVRVRDPNPFVLNVGRFVLYDGRRVRNRQVRAALTPHHHAIDTRTLDDGGSADPVAALLDTRGRLTSWDVEGTRLYERVARQPRAALRRRLLERLRERVTSLGGVWARLAPFPYPYRSAFNIRVDLDEPRPDDYFRFARGRAGLEDCTTHFVSTRAYARFPSVMADLRCLDTQSHGHHHVVYRDEPANRRNLERAHAALVVAGITPTAFAAPEGRWNPGLDRAVEDLGYQYASEFQVGYDDLPFRPWRDGRFSAVLQVPVHPVCEGLFLDAGIAQPRLMAAYFQRVIRAKVEAGEPAFVYGHPERRLARFPELPGLMAEAVRADPLVWRVTLTEFAQWWRWREQRGWSLLSRGPGQYEVQFDEWDATHDLALDIQRGEHVARLPVTGPRMTLRLDDVAFVRRRHRTDLPLPRAARRPWSLRRTLRTVLDWETVTPIEELPEDTALARFRKGLRRWRASGRPSG